MRDTNSNLVLGIDIGGTHIRTALVNEKYELSAFSMKKTQMLLSNEKDNNLDPIVGLANIVSDFCNENQIAISDLSAVAIGFPSTIDAKREVVISTPNIPPLQNLPVVELLSAKLGIPVFINRDVNFILLSDLEDLDIPHQVQSVCGFYIGTGLGNTIMINGRLLIGNRGCAGELGHIHVIGNTKQCGCGNKGCIELLSGGLALAQIQKEHYPDTYIGDIFKLHKDEPPVRQYIENLAVAVSTEMVIIDPELCVFGGGVMQMSDFPREYFEDCIYRMVRQPCEKGSLNMLYVKESQQAGVRGAGIYAFKRLLDSTYL